MYIYTYVTELECSLFCNTTLPIISSNDFIVWVRTLKLKWITRDRNKDLAIRICIYNVSNNKINVNIVLGFFLDFLLSLLNLIPARTIYDNRMNYERSRLNI